MCRDTPEGCGKGFEKVGTTCLVSCPTGFRREGKDCAQKCPDGWRDDWIWCRLSEYGRGAGFPGWTKKGRMERCEAKHGVGNCEEYGVIAYPKCRFGYVNVGCCLCRPGKNPHCEELGLDDQNGVCYKRIMKGKCLSVWEYVNIYNTSKN
jgi:hypothetical protein